MRYFRKEVPKTPIFLPNGDQIQFEPRDGRLGFYQTDNPDHIAALQKLEKEHRGGVSEISGSAEFEASKKKAASTPSGPGWRQEITGGVAQDTMLKRVAPAESAAVVVAAAVNPPKAAEPMQARGIGEAPAPKPPVKPPIVGKRP